MFPRGIVGATETTGRLTRPDSRSVYLRRRPADLRGFVADLGGDAGGERTHMARTTRDSKERGFRQIPPENPHSQQGCGPVWPRA
jgi:hypothetical protein